MSGRYDDDCPTELLVLLAVGGLILAALVAVLIVSL